MRELLSATAFRSGNETWTLGISVATAVTLGFITHKYIRKNRLRGEEGDNLDVASIGLSAHDEAMMVYPPSTTLTWFRGDYRKARVILERRMNLILEKNPWLQGQIAKKSKGGYHLIFIKDQINIDNHLVVIDETSSPISRDTPVDKLGEFLSESTAKEIFLKNGTGQCVFRACIIPCRKNCNSYFALMFQLNHSIGDAATHYNLHHMLCSISEECILPLNPIRDAKFHEQIVTRMGKEEIDFNTSPVRVVHFLWGLLKTVPFYNPSTTHCFKYAFVDPSKMEQSKADAIQNQEDSDDRVPFVSTNDVITSWFMRGAKCDYGDMAVNLRGRLEGISDINAGNYENMIHYRKEDFDKPVLIRRSLQSLKRVVTADIGMPAFYSFVSSRVAAVTNWSSVAKPNAIDGCQEELHLPIQVRSSYWGSLLPSSMSILIIFRASDDMLGLSCYHAVNANLLSDAPFII